jgi:Protein of unknown function (DUF1822)
MDTIERDFVSQFDNQIDLPQSAIEEASLLSENIRDPLSAWQVYLAHLGLTGLTEWIETYIQEGGLPLRFDRSQARLLPPTASDLPAAITQIKLGDFKLCMIAITDSDEIVEIPQMAIDHPEQAGHFYVTVSVNIEAEIVGIKGFIRYDQIQERNLSVSSNGVYEIAIEQFEPQLDRLFFLATGLNPGAIVLPQAAPKLAPAPIRQMLIRPIMNAAAWGKQQLEASLEALDDFLDQVNGQNLHLANGFRGAASTAQRVNVWSEVWSALKQQGQPTPTDVQYSREDVVIGDITVSLEMARWHIPTSNDSGALEWSLVILAKPMNILPEAVQIRIEYKEENIEMIELKNQDSCHYMQAIGNLDELFTIAIRYADIELVLPPVGIEVKS